MDTAAAKAQLTDDELTPFIPERLRVEWQASRTHPHCKWDADAVIDFFRELALARSENARLLEALEEALEEAQEEAQAERESFIRWGRAIWHRFMWEVGYAEVERDVAQGKLRAVREWNDDGRHFSALDRILRGSKEGE